MKELSIFIDESGDFGEFAPHSPFYIISMVFHNQDYDISPAVANLKASLSYLGLSDVCIHTGPIIRKEEIYAEMDVPERRRIFNKMMAFIRQVHIRYRCFSVDKRHIISKSEVSEKLAKQIQLFILSHYEDFLSFDEVKIYYDNGQVEVQKILSSVFNSLLPHPIFRKVLPADYKLFQVADLICSLELLRLKIESNQFTRSESLFFGNLREIKKNYLESLSKKMWD